MRDVISHHERAVTTASNQHQQTSSGRSLFGDVAFLFRAYMMLIHFERYLQNDEFGKLRTDVSECVREQRALRPHHLERIVRAVDLACIWYWKEVLCLQRSAALACLLKKSGEPAQLVLGVQQLPFKAHAWVEVEGRVVSDKPYMRDLYTVLDSF